ncbi:MAG: hypothetical protein ACK5L3_14550 [Oscillospiraceae bacterium]
MEALAAALRGKRVLPEFGLLAGSLAKAGPAVPLAAVAAILPQALTSGAAPALRGYKFLAGLLCSPRPIFLRFWRQQLCGRVWCLALRRMFLFLWQFAHFTTGKS